MADDEMKSKRNDGGYKRNRKDGSHGVASKQRKEVDMSSPVIQAFSIYQGELDQKHDKYERIVKLSRDVTIESKRIIFLLHRITGNTNKEGVMKEASERLTNVQSTMLSRIAEEMESEDLARFLNAFTGGLQEYIEAVAFFVYQERGRLVTRQEVIKEFMLLKRLPSKEEKVDGKLGKPEDSEQTLSKEPEGSSPTVSGVDKSGTPLLLDLPPLEYILGLADFTGELMRLCINSIGDGDLQLPYELVDFLRQVYDGFQLIGNQSGRELTHKLRTLRQSLAKVEKVCYTLQVRGSEIPKHLLLDAINTGDCGNESYTRHEIET